MCFVFYVECLFYADLFCRCALIELNGKGASAVLAVQRRSPPTPVLYDKGTGGEMWWFAWKWEKIIGWYAVCVVE